MSIRRRRVPRAKLLHLEKCFGQRCQRAQYARGVGGAAAFAGGRLVFMRALDAVDLARQRAFEPLRQGRDRSGPGSRRFRLSRTKRRAERAVRATWCVAICDVAPVAGCRRFRPGRPRPLPSQSPALRHRDVRQHRPRQAMPRGDVDEEFVARLISEFQFRERGGWQLRKRVEAESATAIGLWRPGVIGTQQGRPLRLGRGGLRFGHGGERGPLLVDVS